MLLKFRWNILYMLIITANLLMFLWLAETVCSGCQSLQIRHVVWTFLINCRTGNNQTILPGTYEVAFISKWSFCDMCFLSTTKFPTYEYIFNNVDLEWPTSVIRNRHDHLINPVYRCFFSISTKTPSPW